MELIWNKIKSHKYFLVSFLINIILCFGFMSNCKGSDPTIEYITKTDTITVTEERIVEKTKIKYINTVDTFFIQNNDTIFIEVPIEHKQYKDTIRTDSTEARIEIDFYGYASGIEKVRLEYDYYKEIHTKPQKKWGFGITVGPYIGYGLYGDIQNRTFGHGFEIGIGINVGLTRNIQIK